jgi:hypothetical protein
MMSRSEASALYVNMYILEWLWQFLCSYICCDSPRWVEPIHEPLQPVRADPSVNQQQRKCHTTRISTFWPIEQTLHTLNHDHVSCSGESISCRHWERAVSSGRSGQLCGCSRLTPNLRLIKRANRSGIRVHGPGRISS